MSNWTFDPTKINKEMTARLRCDSMQRFAPITKTMMTKALGEDEDWIIIDSTYIEQIFRRMELLSQFEENYSWLYGCETTPESDIATRELLGYVIDYLIQRYPFYFQYDGNIIRCHLTGIEIDINTTRCLETLMLLVSEDMVFMLPKLIEVDTYTGLWSTVYPVKGGVLAFPNGWSLFQKGDDAESREAARFNKTVYEIHHGHVDHYEDHFVTAVDRFFQVLKPGQKFWRRNWSPSLRTELFKHSDWLSHLPSLGFDPDKMEVEYWANKWVRSEHETFVKLPMSGAIIFSIKTFIWELEKMLSDPIVANKLLFACDHMMENEPGMVSYRADALPTFQKYIHTKISK